MTSHSFSVRSEADVLALIPFTLGFHPEDSLVLITLGGDAGPFHARIDLPDDPGQLSYVVEHLVFAAVRNRGDRAMVVVLEASGIETLVELRADGARWYPLGLSHLDLRSVEGVPYDVRSHELTSRSVLDGKVTFRSREELADSLSPVDPDAVEEVATAHAALGVLDAGDRAVLREEGAWLVDQLRTMAAYPTGGHLPPAVAARALRAVGEHDVRDLAWCQMTRDNAQRHVGLWRDLVRRSPEELVAPAAGLLAFSAWLAGDGALAWCAVDRSLRADPDHTLARLVSQALEAALPPSSWEPPDPESLPLHGC
jgi:hypothetical protein